MNELIVNDKVNIENMIYEIRGKQVMLDSDLAKLYKCANGTKAINLAVKRHIERFPERFMFQLSVNDVLELRFQSETANNMTRSLPYVFTEQGVAMLATILRTNVAAEISIRIMDAFVTMRQYISSNLIEQRYINNIVLEDHELIKDNIKNIKLLQESFDMLNKSKNIQEIYFNGQIYDAYSKILSIFKECVKELIIIDSYADNIFLDIIKNINVNVTIITKKNNLLTNELINRHNKQYNNLKVVFNDSFNDRYFILDHGIIYHCGTSINRIGYKTFSINLLSDDEVKKSLLHNIKTIIFNS